jgi:hypothetical protein
VASLLSLLPQRGFVHHFGGLRSKTNSKQRSNRVSAPEKKTKKRNETIETIENEKSDDRTKFVKHMFAAFSLDRFDLLV